MSSEKFFIELEVRDNELDAQGIVNNANYMIYLSHARHKHGEKLGIHHVDYAKKKLKLVITSCEIKFKNSLSAGDVFSVSSQICNSDTPYHWSHKQEIRRLSDNKLILRATFNATCINENENATEKLFIPDDIAKLISGSNKE